MLVHVGSVGSRSITRPSRDYYKRASKGAAAFGGPISNLTQFQLWHKDLVIQAGTISPNLVIIVEDPGGFDFPDPELDDLAHEEAKFWESFLFQSLRYHVKDVQLKTILRKYESKDGPHADLFQRSIDCLAEMIEYERRVPMRELGHGRKLGELQQLRFDESSTRYGPFLEKFTSLAEEVEELQRDPIPDASKLTMLKTALLGNARFSALLSDIRSRFDLETRISPTVSHSYVDWYREILRATAEWDSHLSVNNETSARSQRRFKINEATQDRDDTLSGQAKIDATWRGKTHPELGRILNTGRVLDKFDIPWSEFSKLDRDAQRSHNVTADTKRLRSVIDRLVQNGADVPKLLEGIPNARRKTTTTSANRTDTSCPDSSPVPDAGSTPPIATESVTRTVELATQESTITVPQATLLALQATQRAYNALKTNSYVQAASKGTDICNMLSSSRGTVPTKVSPPIAPTPGPAPPSDATPVEREVKVARHYVVASSADDTGGDLSLMDSGANGGVAGSDCLVVCEKPHIKCHVKGIENNDLGDIHLADVAFKLSVRLPNGSDQTVILMCYDYALFGQGKSIHSTIQMEHAGHLIESRAAAFGGRQCITFQDGSVAPFASHSGLMYLQTSKPTFDDLETYPVIHGTNPTGWDPTSFDFQPTLDQVTNAASAFVPTATSMFTGRVLPTGQVGDLLPSQGDFSDIERLLVHQTAHNPDGLPLDDSFPDYVTACIEAVRSQTLTRPPHMDVYVHSLSRYSARPPIVGRTVNTKPDINKLRPMFLYQPDDRIDATFKHTTQLGGLRHGPSFRHHEKSRFPALNVRRLGENFSSDTIFSDVPAMDDGIPGHGGCTMVQLFGGVTSRLLKAYPMRSKADVPKAYADFVRSVGAPLALHTDCAPENYSQDMKDLHRLFCTNGIFSEPYYQNQNPIERLIQDLKSIMRRVMDALDVPSNAWLLCLLYVTFVMNRTSLASLNDLPPLSVAYGGVTDISPMLHFHFWQPVFFEHYDKTFPSSSPERLGRVVGIAEDCGDALTYLVLDDLTGKAVPRSNIRAASSSDYPNLRVYPSSSDGAPTLTLTTPPRYYMSDSQRPETEGTTGHDGGNTGHEGENTGQDTGARFTGHTHDGLNPYLMRPTTPDDRPPRFTPEELRGTSFLIDEEDGSIMRGQVIELVQDKDGQRRLITQIGEGSGAYQEIMDYNDLCDMITRQREAEATGELSFFPYRAITNHKYVRGTDQARGSAWNVQVLWEDGTRTWEPLGTMIKDDPFTLAAYAKEHDLLEKDGWKRLRRYAKNQKKLNRMVKQSRTQRVKSKVYKYGVEVPYSYRRAMEIDKETGTTMWVAAITKELNEIDSHNTFHNLGRQADGVKPPAGYSRMRVHFVFDVKADGRRKARLVAGGNQLDPPKDVTYAGVASLRSVRIVTLLSELNRLSLVGLDIGNAYLTAKCKEKVYFIGGPEMQHGDNDYSGCVLRVDRALYGLRSSGSAYHDSFATSLRALGFFPCKADPDIWIRDAGDCYEYVAVYVDDLLAALKEPKTFIEALQSPPLNYSLKGGVEPSFHLGGSFTRDPDGTLCWNASKYIERLREVYETTFGTKPIPRKEPMHPSVVPELDGSPLCEPDDITRFQRVLGALQWTISLCRFDIAGAVLCLNQFNCAPRTNHLKWMRGIADYVISHPTYGIRFRTLIPDYSHLEVTTYDWSTSVYGDPKEALPHDAPPPKGFMVRTSTYVDANLLHNRVTGRSCTGVIHFLNQTPIDWFSKRQAQVETATYGSEFVAARQATEQIMDLRYTLRMMGVPLDGPSWMFGDNKGVVQSSTIPHSQLSKRWCALSYHRVREAIASGFLHFLHLEGKQNCADILTKLLHHFDMKDFIIPIMDFTGDTLAYLPRDDGDDTSHSLVTPITTSDECTTPIPPQSTGHNDGDVTLCPTGTQEGVRPR